jgi:hypothetical protein
MYGATESNRLCRPWSCVSPYSFRAVGVSSVGKWQLDQALRDDPRPGPIPASRLAASILPGPSEFLHGHGTVQHVRIGSVLVNDILPNGGFFGDRSSTGRGERGVVLESRASQKMVGMSTCE